MLDLGIFFKRCCKLLLKHIRFIVLQNLWFEMRIAFTKNISAIGFHEKLLLLHHCQIDVF